MNNHSQTDSTIDYRPAGSVCNKVEALVPGERIQRIIVAEHGIQLLIEQAKLRNCWEPGYEEMARLIEALPLPTAEFELAKRHLENALEYSRNGEFGAASFELRMVRGCVQRL
jgi:hypothetical protein